MAKRKNKKLGVQESLFPQEQNLVTLEEYKNMGGKRKQHEKKFMKEVMEAAFALDLPCIHIEYFCGNKFYATCDSCSTKQNRVRAVCPSCHRPVVVTCHNRINKHLAGHHDILGIDWAIETKHKINKGKQSAKGDIGQQIKSVIYDACAVPNITVNEADNIEIFNFLRKVHNHKYPDRQV